MKNLIAAVLAASCAFAAPAGALEANEIAAARTSAEQWLKLVDAEDYAGAWNNSASDVRENTSRLAWTMVMSASHLPLGSIKSRRLKAAVPDADGSHVRLQYASTFDKDKNVNETVTMVQEKNGAWRVTGYGINAQ